MSKFDSLINSFLKEEELSDRQKRSKALRSARTPMLKIGTRVQVRQDLQIPALFAPVTELSRNQIGTIVDYSLKEDEWAVEFEGEQEATSTTLWLKSDDLIPI